jgi:chloramphenicol 3-O phosphotransferase
LLGIYYFYWPTSEIGYTTFSPLRLADGYSVPLGILPNCAQILNGHQVFFVGVRCPIEIIMERRIDTWNVGYTPDGKVPKPVSLWQHLVHVPGIYDLEIDTSVLTPEECAKLIQQRLEDGPSPTAFQRIRGIGDK